MSVRLLAGCVLLATVVASGCGDETASGTPGSSVDAGPSTVGAPLPATSTTTFETSDPSATPIVSLPPIEVTEPCPESEANGAGEQEMVTESSRLEPMLGQVLAYGSERPDEFGGYGLVWHGAGDASVFVSFSANVAAHRTALEAMVEHPDELIVCHVAVSGNVAQAMQDTLVRELEGRILSIGRGRGAIEITLAANEELLAGELLARYGDAVEITVGALAFPLEEAEAVCDDPPTGNSLPGLRIEVIAPSEPVSATGVMPLELTVVLTNDSDTPIQFGSGTAIGTILDQAGEVVSSSTVFAIADVGIGVDLAPGQSMQLPLVASTASCDPALGYTLPPGDYRLVAAVQHSDGDTMRLHSPPVPIVVGE